MEYNRLYGEDFLSFNCGEMLGHPIFVIYISNRNPLLSPSMIDPTWASNNINTGVS